MYYSMFMIINQHQILRCRENFFFLKLQLASLVQQLTRTRTLQKKTENLRFLRCSVQTRIVRKF